jgi:hypothetical protein
MYTHLNEPKFEDHVNLRREVETEPGELIVMIGSDIVLVPLRWNLEKMQCC